MVPYPTVFVVIGGVHLYGFPTPNSSYDLRGIHLLPVQAVVGLTIGEETIRLSQWQSSQPQGNGVDTLETVGADLETHDIKKFCSLLLKKNGAALEHLYSPLVVQTTPAHDQLKTIAQSCITRNHVYHYAGLAATHWHLLRQQQPYPTVQGLLHVYRLLLTGIHLLRSGMVIANLTTLNQEFQLPYITDLITCNIHNRSQTPLSHTEMDFHTREYHRLQRLLDEASRASTLPDLPTSKAELHDILVRLRLASNPSHPNL